MVQCPSHIQSSSRWPLAQSWEVTGHLPLAVPLLIFGTLASQSDRGIISPHLMLLGAVFALLLALAPLVAASALEIGETETGL